MSLYACTVLLISLPTFHESAGFDFMYASIACKLLPLTLTYLELLYYKLEDVTSMQKIG